jgi:hypothetical protein
MQIEETDQEKIKTGQAYWKTVVNFVNNCKLEHINEFATQTAAPAHFTRLEKLQSDYDKVFFSKYLAVWDSIVEQVQQLMSMNHCQWPKCGK